MGPELPRNRSPALYRSVRPVVPAYPTCYLQRTFAPMPRPRVYSERSRGALLTPPVTIPSPLPALPSTNHRFFTPFFSAPSELLFSQLLSFHNHLRCPLVFSLAAKTSQRHPPSPTTSHSATSHLFSECCRLFASLASLFRTRPLCLQPLAESFCKTPGVWGPQ